MLNGAGSLLDLLMQVNQKALAWLKAIFLQTSSLRCGEIWVKNEQWLLARQASIRGLAKSIEKFLKKKRMRTRLTCRAKDVNMVKWRMETSYEENFSDNTVGDRDFLRYFVVSLSSFFSDQV